MNFLPMSYYLAIVQAQGISRAAERLFITQQTLSAHVAAMERELGCRLFERRPAFRLTRAGEVFYRYCLQFQSLQESMAQEFRDLSRADSAVVGVGISQTRSRILMPPVLSRLHGSHPRLQVRLSEQTNEVLLERLEQGALDVIIGDVPGDRPELRTADFYQERLVLAASKALLSRSDFQRLTAQGDLGLLAQYPFVMNAQNDVAGRYGSVLLEKAGVVPKLAAMSDSAETCLQLCRDGLGLYICPDLYLRFFREYREQLHLLPLPFSYPIRIACRNGRYTPAGVTAFVEECLAFAREEEAPPF